MKSKSVCFTGHRSLEYADVPIIREKLRDTIEQHIEKGFTEFYNGGARGFDLLSAEVVLSLRELYPHIRLHIIVPCKGQTRGWREEDIALYESIHSRADEVKVLSPFYFNGCMQIRNRYMVDASSVCIAFVREPRGGSADTAKYAEKQGLQVIYL